MDRLPLEQRQFFRFGTSWSCPISALFNFARWGFRSSMENGRPVGDATKSVTSWLFEILVPALVKLSSMKKN